MIKNCYASQKRSVIYKETDIFDHTLIFLHCLLDLVSMTASMIEHDLKTLSQHFFFLINKYQHTILEIIFQMFTRKCLI